MAKQIKKQGTPTPATAQKAEAVPAVPAEKGFSIHFFKTQCIIIAIIGLLFYANSFGNEYALDDRPMIIENEFVKKGFAGIPSILVSDAFASYLNQQHSDNALSGGRYRPLSIITFAFEQQLLGTRGEDELADTTRQIKGNMLSDVAIAKIHRDMHVRHVINVLLYIFSVMVALYFMRTILFPGNTLLPFAAAILFLVHPIHTEVVANVKSRDEILSLLFICLTFLHTIRYVDDKKASNRTMALVYFFLALLSKEYALALIGLLPLTLVVLRGQSLETAFKGFLPFLIPLGVYALLRFSATRGSGNAPDDVMNVPYLFANGPVQKAASIVANLLYYIRFLVWPSPLVSDYSYHQIPYSDITNPLVWLSLATYGGILYALYWSFRKKNELFFPIAFFVFNLALVGNIFINIGAPLGERLIYHSSLGFAIVVAWLLFQAYERISNKQTGMALITVSLSVVTVLSAVKVIARNPEWKNDQTLFTTDVQTSPNSVLILSNAGSANIDIADDATDSTVKLQHYKQGIDYLKRALAIHPTFANGYLNLGVAYYKSGYPDSSLKYWDSVRKYYPTHPNLPYVYRILSNYYYKEGINYGKAGIHQMAAVNFAKAAIATPDDGDVMYNAGFAFYSSGDYASAVRYFQRAVQIAPNNKRNQEYLQMAQSHLSTPTPTGIQVTPGR
ncbi:MAG: tetratricopeptide repeat protein [Chitinophagia bacterium]|nr:tetratricopeptide repeat protein [Chitinophagia bacterium]